MAERFPGLASRIRERIRALGYWKYDKLNVADFCAELKYDPRSVYPWIKAENPRYPAESLDRLVEDLKTTKAYLVHGIGPAATEAQPAEAPDIDDTMMTQAQQIAELTPASNGVARRAHQAAPAGASPGNTNGSPTWGTGGPEKPSEWSMMTPARDGQVSLLARPVACFMKRRRSDPVQCCPPGWCIVEGIRPPI